MNTQMSMSGIYDGTNHGKKIGRSLSIMTAMQTKKYFFDVYVVAAGLLISNALSSVALPRGEV